MGICSSSESEVIIIGANGPQLNNPNREVFVRGGVLRFSISGKIPEKEIPVSNLGSKTLNDPKKN